MMLRIRYYLTILINLFPQLRLRTKEYALGPNLSHHEVPRRGDGRIGKWISGMDFNPGAGANRGLVACKLLGSLPR